MPYPILFESRRRSLQRFLKLSGLDIESLWFPLVPEILKAKFSTARSLKLTIDRTSVARQKCFVISLIWDKRAIPLYWQLLDKKGSSNIRRAEIFNYTNFRVVKRLQNNPFRRRLNLEALN